jgi:hypothetical protein
LYIVVNQQVLILCLLTYYSLSAKAMHSKTRVMKSNLFKQFTLIPTIVITSLFLGTYLAQPMYVSRGANSAKTTKVITPKGKSFFPLGFYHVSNRLTSTQRTAALQDIAEAGFNIIHAGCSNLDEYSQFLDEANRLGIYVITEFDYTNYDQIVQRFKDKPAVLGWNIADDAGDHKTKVQILDLHRKIKEIDPVHYTSISISGWSRKWAEFADAADLIGGQVYPVGYNLSNKIEGLPNNLIEVNHSFSLASTEANKHNRPFIANVQAFRWDNQRSPTAKEVYNMTYQSLLAGVKGILFFAYDDGGKNNIRENPLVWNQLKLLVPEIKKLSPILVNGKLTKLNTKNKELLASQWEYKNQFYVIIVNTSQSNTISTSIKMPIKKSFVKSFLNRQPPKLKLQDGYLAGSIKPEDVQVYQIHK